MVSEGEMSLVHSFSRSRQTTPEGRVVAQYSTEAWNPAAETRVNTVLEVQSVSFRRPVDERSEFFVDLVLRENFSDIPERFQPKTGTSEVFISIPISGKETNLFTGLTGREVHFLGRVPESCMTLQELQLENQTLRERLDDVLFHLREAFSRLGRSSEQGHSTH